MTQQPKRDATEELEAIENELSAPWSKAGRYGLGRAIYWIKEAESQRERAEAAAQERDKLLETIHAAIVALNTLESGRFDKQIVADMLERIIKEGSNTDGQTKL